MLQIKKQTLIRIFFVLLAIGIGIWALNMYTVLWNTNSILVKADSPLTAGKVKIEFGISANVYAAGTAENLLTNRKKYNVLLFDGKTVNKMPNEYGENDFLITYDNKYYFKFRHFKTNWKHEHEYTFHLFEKDNNILVHIDIKGENPQIVQGLMLSMKDAE